MSELSLRAENLHLWRGERHVLRGVALEVTGGEVLQVTGTNGAGKTTLLRALCGLMHPEEGRVVWGGRDVRDDLATFHGALIYLGHEPPLKADLTACENLKYWVGLRRRITVTRIASALESVGIPGLAERLVRTLSAGQKRRVALAGLVLLAVPLWLLDEPTTNLDSEGQRLVGRLIEEHTGGGGLTVAAVHHELAVSPQRLRRLELARA
ncbi:MAG TPA: cytochrome c biogenesis heme-transporting ATPase CcmA [Steroidobacteraceae bacterium]|nr:cytochrome c biogenesis heme-transporting ATPase CcmA [Steroidobacteraceae bacterium]